MGSVVSSGSSGLACSVCEASVAAAAASAARLARSSLEGLPLELAIIFLLLFAPYDESLFAFGDQLGKPSLEISSILCLILQSNNFLRVGRINSFKFLLGCGHLLLRHSKKN